MKRKFCGLFRDIFKNCENFSYEALFVFFWQEAESAYADLKSNFKIRGCLRPYWPQIASDFIVRFQIRVSKFCLLPQKCEYCFIGIFFIIFENIPKKPTKFPFHSRITRFCSVDTAKMTAILQSEKINLAHPVQ